MTSHNNGPQGTSPTPHEARQLARWRRLAESGDADAQLQLGLAITGGYGVTADSYEGVRWLAKAAEQGHVEARHLLGLAFRDGTGIERDSAMARYWLSQAAAAGHASAALALEGIGE